LSGREEKTKNAAASRFNAGRHRRVGLIKTSHRKSLAIGTPGGRLGGAGPPAAWAIDDDDIDTADANCCPRDSTYLDPRVLVNSDPGSGSLTRSERQPGGKEEMFMSLRKAATNQNRNMAPTRELETWWQPHTFLFHYFSLVGEQPWGG